MTRDIFTEPGFSLYTEGQVLVEGKYTVVCADSGGHIYITRDLYKGGKFSIPDRVILYKHEKDIFGPIFEQKLVFTIPDTKKLPTDIEHYNGVEVKSSGACLEGILILDRKKTTWMSEKLVRNLLERGIIVSS